MDARKNWRLTPQKCSPKLYNRLTFALARLRFGRDADIFPVEANAIRVGFELSKAVFPPAGRPEVVEPLPLLGVSDERSQECTSDSA